ncbi:MAG: endonuclease/exonuclease/phosphatase, partial [Porphyromonas sp.]|nr:endonuclease/exonuclease/phosphatase [Porphyromonas sp.]
MKHRYTALFSLAFLLLTLHISSPQLWAQRKLLRVMSYNVENFFDTEDDPTHDDASFLPTGEQHWTHARYQTKIQHIAEVISTVGGEAFPDLIALMEIENATVLSDLLHRTALGEKAGYRHIITHGEDKRGINVALLYAPETFRLITSEELPIHFPFDSLRRTRSLLRVTGEVPSGDTLHVFVCHLPSRRGGALASARYRNYCCMHLCE